MAGAQEDWRVELAAARVLLVNDDGVAAPGMDVLEQAVAPLCRELWVVAPEKEESGTGHAFSLHRPVRLRQAGERRFAVDGLPTDATMMALGVVMKDAPPDIVLSGVNRGANLGDDASYSGTVGAAMEAALSGFPAIAFSQNKAPTADPKWETSLAHIGPTLDWLLAQNWPAGAILNVNFPDCAPDSVMGRRVTRLARRKPGGEIAYGLDPAGKPYHWISSKRIVSEVHADSDVQACMDNYISMTPLGFDLTDHVLLERARSALGA